MASVDNAVLRVRPATRPDVPQVEELIARSARVLTSAVAPRPPLGFAL